MKLRKKLIEVALPLEAINIASAREKSIRHGHPSTLHLWWARRPLAAARAVIFAQMVDDPSEYVDELLAVAETQRLATLELERLRIEWNKRDALHKQAIRVGNSSVPAPGPEPTLHGCVADLERERLFEIIRQFVLWENTTNEAVLSAAREEIWKSWRRTCEDNKDHPRANELFNPNKLPPFHDPFAGGGALPLEAQRLGLESYASDLNPVAVLINKALIEIPPRFAELPPVNPDSRKQGEMEHRRWHGAQGLADDVRYYGKWILDEAEKRIGHLYPKVEITAAMAKDRSDLKPLIGQKLTVITWLWARTVKSPNPAFAEIDVPLASSFSLSLKPGKEAFVEPIVRADGCDLVVRAGKKSGFEEAKNGTKLARGANFRCIMSNSPISSDYVKTEGRAGRLGVKLLGVVAESDRGRIFLSPALESEEILKNIHPGWKPDVDISGSTQYIGVKPYGMTQFSELFTTRQLMMLTTFCDLVSEAWKQVKRDASEGGCAEDSTGYADAVAAYLGATVSKIVAYHCTLSIWRADLTKTGRAFGRQAIQMVWDFAECNPFAGAGGDWQGAYQDCAGLIASLPSSTVGHAWQSAAQHVNQTLRVHPIVSTDPPYYDNVPYADLSDFYYVWLRRSLQSVFPDLFATVASPKADELVAFAYRHAGKQEAEAFFMSGMTDAIRGIARISHSGFPVTMYYAFRQSETDSDDGVASTGWETFLDAVIKAGFAISGTWPMRTELSGALKTTRNALASSIILVCHSRDQNAPTTSRRDFSNTLTRELPYALAHLQRSNIAPVDLAQAAIGPGMAIYTRYSNVIDVEGKPLSVREALALINQTLDEVLAEQEGDFDADTRWALAWFEQAGFEVGEFGVAETLSKAKNTSVQGLKEAGIIDKKSPVGKVRLLRPAELLTEWNPETDQRLTVWEMVHHLIRVLEFGGESAAAELLAKLGGKAEVARELTYRLYTLCERKKRAAEALSYNGLVQSWPEMSRLAREGTKPREEQSAMFS
jgi:putative DNA methylase